MAVCSIMSQLKKDNLLGKRSSIIIHDGRCDSILSANNIDSSIMNKLSIRKCFGEYIILDFQEEPK